MALLQTGPMLVSTPAMAGRTQKENTMFIFMLPAILITALFGSWSVNEQ